MSSKETRNRVEPEGGAISADEAFQADREPGDGRKG